ncbi:hypothetical protein [Planomonospora sp. ID82291]|uniref:hypothetical protein n=1 Tax=Planomonospora sp. ID82291 TaxID=2738136 RepID=UPI0018C3EFDC|nr:hypothetical protein [Planomonospora sp. ID82291]MBG0819145.1 hypothetical protein [Planomonospora sp. ID82291]
MKGPFKRANEAVESTTTEIRETLDHVERVATVGLIAFGLVAVVAVTALMIAAAGRPA